MELSKKMKSQFSQRRGEWSTGVKHPGRNEGRESTELVGRPSMSMPRVGSCEARQWDEPWAPALPRRRAESLGGHPQGTCVSDHCQKRLQEQVYVRTGSLEAKLRQQGEQHPLSVGVWGCGDEQRAWRGLRGRQTGGIRRQAGLRSGSAFAFSLQSVSKWLLSLFLASGMECLPHSRCCMNVYRGGGWGWWGKEG